MRAAMESLDVSDSMLLNEASNQSYLEARGATVRTVYLSPGRRDRGDPAVNRMATYIGRYCPNLRTFQSFREHSPAALSAVAKGCPLLEHILLRGDSTVDAHIDVFAQRSHQLKSVNIVCGSKLSEMAFVRLVQNCHLLDQVFICCTETRLTDAFFVQVAQNCPLLTTLEVSYARLGHAGLEAMAAHCRKLRTFSFSEGRINITDRKGTSAFPAMLELKLYDVHIDDVSLEALLRCCPTVQTIDFLEVFDPTEAGLLAALPRCPLVQKLCLPALGPAVTDAVLRGIADACRHLRYVNLRYCRSMTDAGLCALIQQSPHLEELHVRDNEQLSDEVLIALGEHCPALRHVDVTGSDVTCGGILALMRRFPQLTHQQAAPR